MGKIVAPRAYVTIGISCAIQRLAGVKDSNVIIEIIKDHVSPISSAVDCGLNGDLLHRSVHRELDLSEPLAFSRTYKHANLEGRYLGNPTVVQACR